MKVLKYINTNDCKLFYVYFFRKMIKNKTAIQPNLIKSYQLCRILWLGSFTIYVVQVNFQVYANNYNLFAGFTDF